MSLFSDADKAKEAFFKNTFLLEKSIPDAKDRQRFLEVTSFVSSTEEFNRVSKLDYLLRLDISNESLSYGQRSQVSNWFNNKEQYDACIPDDNVNHFFTWGQRFDALRETIDDSLMDNILTGLENDISIIDSDVNPLSFGTDNDVYKAVMKNYCKAIFEHYVEKNANFNLSKGVINSMVDEVLTYVDNRADKTIAKFATDCGAGENDITDTYYGHVYNFVMTRFSRTNSNTQYIAAMKMMLLCFYPYFLYDYIISNVARQDGQADGNHNNYLFHRMAVLVSYTFIFFATAIFIQRTKNVRGTSKHYTRVLSLLSKINDDIFSRESLSKQSEENNVNLHENIVETRRSANELQEKHQLIQQMRTNVEKAAYNNVLIQPMRTSAKRYMYLWLAILLLNIVLTFVTLLFYFNYKSTFIVVQTGSLVLVIVYYVFSIVRGG